MHQASGFLAVMALWLGFASPIGAELVSCETQVAFEQPDEGGSRRARIYEQMNAGKTAPLFFIDSLKTNTDGSVTSYHKDDPLGIHNALNDIIYAMSPAGRERFEELRDNDWEPASETQEVLGNVIEFDSRSGKPCITADGYMISMTYVPAFAGADQRTGDCDPRKWLDGLTIPSIVLPLAPEGAPGTGFDTKGADARNFVVGMTIKPPYRLAYGIVGDKGPSTELGEATIAFNRDLNGLPAETMPRDYPDVKRRFQGARSIVMIFPGAANRIAFPITPDRVRSAVEPVFEKWGGIERLKECLSAIRK